MTIAIMGAMAEEVDALVEAMDVDERGRAGRRDWWRGTLEGCDVVVAFSHWGKVAAASTATWLVATHAPSAFVFTGVAGALDPDLSIGDVVVADVTWQHDMDARPIIERHEIPLLGRAAVATDKALTASLAAAARVYLAGGGGAAVGEPARRRFGIDAPRVVVGGIASGDRFVHAAADAADIRARLPDARCVEMEGAAVAQVCTAFDVPFALVRTISDGADEAAPLDFPRFVDEVARAYSLGIVGAWLAGRRDAAARATLGR